MLVSRPGALCVRKKFQSVYAVEAIQATRLPTFTPWPCTRAAAGYLLGARSYGLPSMQKMHLARRVSRGSGVAVTAVFRGSPRSSSSANSALRPALPRK